MKVYFSSSLRAKRLYAQNFELIYKIIEDLGYTHTSKFLLKADPESFYQRKGGDFAQFYEKMVAKIKKADICVFEVTLHSLGIGYCVNLALQMNKPVILLYLKGNLPVFFAGIKSERIQLCEYEPENLREVLKDSLEIAKEMVDTRFTFFISPKISDFLSWVAKNKKIPRAVYIRSLIEEAMKKEGFE